MLQATQPLFEFGLNTLYWIPIYTFLGGISSVLWSPACFRRTGPRPAGYVNIVVACLGFIHSLVALIVVWGGHSQSISMTWLKVADLSLVLPLEYSSQTVGAIVLITGLNILAQVYSVAYLEMDWGWARFFASISLFESGMCFLALCDSLFFSYVILEILTLGTYLLIGVWFNQSLVVTGARDAFLTKRVGDLIMLMAVVALWPLAGTWNYGELADWAAQVSLPPLTITLIGLSLMAGPLGKCAQFPLHLWLDEAMEGPLPASILRNAMVVQTGAWVLVKVQPILALSPVTSAVVIGVGAATAIGATLIAIAQIDIKRALSYSVSAYMGLVFIAMGCGLPKAALGLMLTYAIAMALLVMATGTIVSSNITQDLTQMGGIWSRRPISGIAFLVGGASLVGLPPFGGFWSLLHLISDLWQDHPFLVGVVLMVNGLTALSLARVFCLIFLGTSHPMMTRSPEVLWPMVVPMTLLTGFALHLPILMHRWSLAPSGLGLGNPLGLVLLWSCILGASVGCILYLSKLVPKPIRLGIPFVQDFFAYDLYTAQTYQMTIIGAVSLFSRLISWFDRHVVDGVVNSVGLTTILSGQALKYNNSGFGQFYVLSIVIGLTALVAFVAYPLMF